MSENKATKDAKDLKLEEVKEAEINQDISEAISGATETVVEDVVEAPKEVVPEEKTAPQGAGGYSNQKGRGGAPRGKRPNKEFSEDKDGFYEKVLAVDRVTRVVKGGRRMRFRALVVVGDKKGKIGYGTGKGNEVAAAVQKAVSKAKKDLITVDIYNGTILHDVVGEARSVKILLKSAKKGRGIIAGGSVRSVLELAGYEDIVGKSYGSNNKINNVIATLTALQNLLKKKKS